MRIAVDKTSLKAIKPGNEYIYLFEDETYNELKKLGLHCVRFDRCDFVDINLSKYNVNCVKKATIFDKDFDIVKEKKDFKIAIIIPNCNYADCLEKCFNSIFNQTYQNYQIIFVDDCSTDNSLEVARSLLKPPHKIIPLKQKRYNGGARNEAYLYLEDDIDYVWYVDSDDWLYDNKVLEKINYRLQQEPDVLFVGLAIYKYDRLITSALPNYKDRYEAIRGWSGSCSKVIKKKLATRPECLYNEGTLKEDKNQHCKICIYMNSFTNLPEPVYVWNRQNSKSITTIRDPIVWGTSTIRHYADAKQLALSIEGKDPKIDEYMKERLDLCLREIKEGGDRQF